MGDEQWQALRASQFWLHKSLTDMTQLEWEALCDGCGKCCLHKLIDDETDELYYTNVACKLLDVERVRCQDYSHRHSRVPGCIAFSAETLPQLYWLPASCAYRVLFEGRQLQKWHPLVSGDAESVRKFKRSVSERCVPESQVDMNDIEEYIVRWV